MRQIFRLFFLYQKRWMRTLPLLVLLVTVPFFLLFLHQLSLGSKAEDMTVLLYCESPDELTQAVFSRLQTQKSHVRFLVLNKEEQMKDRIMAGTALCGYSFPNNLEQLLDDNKEEEAITLYRSDSSPLYPFTRELIYGAILHGRVPKIAWDFFEENDRYQKNLTELQKDYADFYLAQQNLHKQRLQLKTIQIGNRAYASEEEPSFSIPVRGLCSILLFVLGLFAEGIYLQDKQKGSYQAFPTKTAAAASYCTVLSLLSLSAVFAALSLILCGEWQKGLSSFLVETASLLIYLILIGTVSSFLGSLLRQAAKLFTLIPLLAIACMVLCPIFLDLGQFVPAVKWLQMLLPPYYYLTASLGGLDFLLFMTGISAVLFLLRSQTNKE